MAALAGPADLAWGAFSESPPWVLDRAELSWSPGIAVLRAEAEAEVPVLTSPTRWPPGARVARVLARLGVALVPWAVRKRRHRYASLEASRADLSRRLRLAAESLGSTYIKLGQIISSGEGLFPAELVEEFKLCRDQVTPESFAVVREVVEADLGRDARSHVHLVRPHAPGRGVDRPGARRPAAHR
jgi:ubiquinone biosynthesis protein